MYEDEIAAREAVLEEIGEAEHANLARRTEKEAAGVQRETEEVDEDEGPDTL